MKKEKRSFYDFCMQEDHPDLLKEWDTEKNLPLTPQQVTSGSDKHIWWRCCAGHTWQAPVYRRSRGSACPYCSNERILPGYNDLATKAPMPAAEWDLQKNLPLTPNQVMYGSNKKVWWRCAKGHEWQAVIAARYNRGTSCPVCANKTVVAGINDLASCRPDLAAEWDDKKNGCLSPQAVFEQAQRKVWWKCPQGHTWQTSPYNRVRYKTACPICAGRSPSIKKNSLSVTHPELAAQWDPIANGSLTPQIVTAKDLRIAAWRCALHHQWKERICVRAARDRGCPYCSGAKTLSGYNDLSTTHSALAAQWDAEKNGILTPQDVSASSTRAVWWQCKLGHTWKTTVVQRTLHGEECPYCSNRTVLPGFNDLATIAPQIAKQWHPLLNDLLKPENVLAISEKPVWWQCPEGHVWRSKIRERVEQGQQPRCPICEGDTSRIKRYARLIRLTYQELGITPPETTDDGNERDKKGA